MNVPKSSGVIVDLMKLNNGQMVSFKARSGEAFKYLQLEVSLCWFWLCSHARMEKKGSSMKDRGWRSTKSNEENEKGQDGHDKSEVGEAEANQWREMGFKNSELDSVSPWEGAVLSLCLLETFLVFLLLFLDLGFNSYWMASARHLRPVAHLLVTQAKTHNDDMMKQQKQAQTQMQMQQLSNNNVNIRKLAHT